MRPNRVLPSLSAALIPALVLAVAPPAPAQPGNSAAPSARRSTAGRSANSPLRVEAFSPTGETRLPNGVAVTFTNDLSSSTLAAMTSSGSLLAFDPSLEGTYRIESPRRIRFLPSNPRQGTEYVARINPQLRDAQGNRISGPTEFRFQTPPLSLGNVRQTGFTPDRRAIVELQFSDEVDPNQLRKKVFLSSGGTPLRWALESDVRTRTPRLITDPLTTDSLHLHIEPGLTGDDGPLGLTEAVSRSIPLTFRLEARQLTAKWEQDKAFLVLEFSNRVDLGTASGFISVSPAVRFHLEEEGNRLLLAGDFRPENRYTVTVRQGLAGAYRQLLLRDVVLSAWVPPMKPFVEMKDAGGHLSTQGRMKLRVRSAGLRSFTVTASRVYDNNMAIFAARSGRPHGIPSFGHEVARKEIAVHGDPGSPATTEVDLRELLGPGASGVYLLETRGKRADDTEDFDGQYFYDRFGRWRDSLEDSALIALSNLGLVAKRSHAELMVWAAALDSARPVAGARVQVYSAKNQLLKEGVTGPDGAAHFSGLESRGEREPVIVIASLGDEGREICYLDLRRSLAGAEEIPVSGRDFLDKGYEAFLSPERGAYRPGETVHLFGHVRGRDASPPPAAFPLELVITRPDGKSLEPRIVNPTETGSFAAEFATAAYAPTGLYRARLQLAGTEERRRKEREAGGTDGADYDEFDYSDYVDETHWREGGRSMPRRGRSPASDVLGHTRFFVEEFLPNRLKVTAEAPERRYTAAEPLTVTVRAEEMFGQPAAGRTVTAVAMLRAEPFSPRGFEDFTFGDSDAKFKKTEVQLEEATVDEDGRVSMTVTLPDVRPPAALRATVQATVLEEGGRGVTAAVERIIDPVPYYLGLKTADGTFPRPGQEARFEIVAVRPDGTLAGDARLTATVSRTMWNSLLKRESDGSHRWITSRELQPLHKATVNVTDGRGSLAFTPPAVGAYQLKVADLSSSAASTLEFYASMSRWEEQPWSLEKPERLELVLDKPRYAPGETARVIVKAPFAGTLLLTQEQDRVLSTTVVEMPQNTIELSVPVEEKHQPNFYLAATVVRPVKPAEKWMPHRAFGFANAPVESGARRLAVDMAVPAEVRPKSVFSVPVSVVDAATSRPAGGAEVTLWAVDEGVLTLTDFRTPDPFGFFFAPRRLMVETADFFSDLMPDLIEPAGARSAPGGGDEVRKLLSPVAAERVRPVVLWLGTRRTDADGRTTATFEVPQFMGRLRVMGVAAESRRFGSGDATVFVRGPVMVKENLPRFAAPGDQLFPSFVVYNNTDSSASLRLEVAASDPLTAVEVNRWKDTGPAQDGIATVTAVALSEEIAPRGQVMRVAEMTAARRAGVAETTFTATSGTESFSGSVQIPVRPASPYVRLTGSAAIPAGEEKQIAIPGGADFFPGTTSATLVVSGLPMVRFAGGLDYLVRYPYGCAEQTVSGAFPLLYLPELAAQVDPGRYSRDGITAAVQGAIDRVLTMQTGSGGMAMWPGRREPHPWASVYAAHFLIEARKAGYQVPEDYMSALLSYVSSQLDGRRENAPPEELTTSAYAAYVLALGGRRNLDRMEGLYEKRDRLPVEARALLASAYMTAGVPQQARDLLKGTVPGSVDGPRKTGGHLYSPVRETAILLVACLEASPGAPEIPGLVQRLEAVTSLRGGHWGTTQETAWALFALGRYTKAREAEARHRIEGTVTLASGEVLEFSSDSPVTLTRGISGTTVTVAVRGLGQAYASWVAEGVPVRGTAAATTVTQGLEVRRRFTDRSGKPISPRRIPQGRLVVVEIEIPGQQSLDNVVIEDLLPAGLEIENAHFTTSEQIDGDREAAGVVVDRTEARDDRMLAFVHLRPSPSGVRVFRYAARAVTPGTFTLPPVQVSCMYDPDIVARGGAGILSVAPAPRK